MKQAIVYCEILSSVYKVDFSEVTLRRIIPGSSQHEKIPLKEMNIPNIAHIIKENNWDENFSIANQIIAAQKMIRRRAEGIKIEKKAVLTDEQVKRLTAIPRFNYSG